MTKRCGFVSVLGEPNAGKSTLLNKIVGAKISIVTHKVQTTRRRILGIVIKDKTQIVLVDTPGIFAPKRRLDKAMVKAAWNAPGEADINLLLVDVSRKDLDPSKEILKKLKERTGKSPLLLCFNKIDRIEKSRLLQISQEFAEIAPVDDIFMISALNGDGVDDLTTYLANTLPESAWLFPDDQMTDIPMRLFAAEITREHALRQLHQELPYNLTIETESWEEFDNGALKISQVIYVTRDAHKAIILGKKGEKIKSIGKAARLELEHLLDCSVHLFLHVKVKEDWQEKADHYFELGLDFDH